MIENFIAIDVETANSARGSICQIGVAAYSGSNRSWTWSTLVNPEEAFDEGNVRVHGIRSDAVQSAPRYPVVFESLVSSIGDRFVISHTRFDCDALHEAARKYRLTFPDVRWIDTCEVARFVWPTLASHSLEALCRHLSIDLKHHDAGSDAVACAEILTCAILETRLGVKQLADHIGLVRPPSRNIPQAAGARRYSAKLSMMGDPRGPLAGEVLICTGEFEMGEPALVKLAASLGCDVEDRFSKKRTTIVVVGKRDPAQFGGKLKSNKLLAAEESVAKGKSIVIVSEVEFLRLARSHLAA